MQEQKPDPLHAASESQDCSEAKCTSCFAAHGCMYQDHYQPQVVPPPPPVVLLPENLKISA